MADGLAASHPEPEAPRSQATPAGKPSAGVPAGARPAYYAANPGGWRDWWTLLHPPYTAWHLSYVVLITATPTSSNPALRHASTVQETG